MWFKFWCPNERLHKRFPVRRTYGLKTTPLPAKFRQSGVFGGRVCCGGDVQFSDGLLQNEGEVISLERQ
jgi:hypothetical protein